MIYALIFIIVLLLCLLGFSFYVINKLLNVFDDIKDVKEEQIEKFDSYYQRISNLLELDLYSDDPHIMELISIMRSIKLSIVNVIEKIYNIRVNNENDKKD